MSAGENGSAAVKLRKVALATPCYTGQVDHGFTLALLHSVVFLLQHGIACQWLVVPGHPYLPPARNKLVWDFLHGSCEEIVFIDADIRWKPRDLLRLLSWDAAVVGGAYPFRRAPQGYPVALSEGGSVRCGWHPELLAAEYVPTGFLRISRTVFERMLAHFGETELLVIDHENGIEVGRYWGFFETGKRGTDWLGEDVNFCRMWREEFGGQVWCDPGLELSHVGTQAFTGTLLRDLEGQGKTAPAPGENAPDGAEATL
jgi:hypothetical protein